MLASLQNIYNSNCAICLLWIGEQSLCCVSANITNTHTHTHTHTLFQVISQNQEAFIALINEEQGEGGQGGQGAAGQGPPPPGAGGGGPFGMPMTIQVTQDEKAAIDRVSRRSL